MDKKKTPKYKKMYLAGFQKMKKDFDILNLIRNQKMLLTLAKSSYLTDKSRLTHLAHAKDNVMDIDDDDDNNHGKVII